MGDVFVVPEWAEYLIWGIIIICILGDLLMVGIFEIIPTIKRALARKDDEQDEN